MCSGERMLSKAGTAARRVLARGPVSRAGLPCPEVRATGECFQTGRVKDSVTSGHTERQTVPLPLSSGPPTRSKETV